MPRVKVQVNSPKALKELIAGDKDLEVQIKQTVIDRFTIDRAKEVISANVDFFKVFLNEVFSNSECFARLDDKNGLALNQAGREAIKKSVKETFNTEIQMVVNTAVFDTINQDFFKEKLKPYMEKAIESYIQEAMKQYVGVYSQKVLESMFNKKKTKKEKTDES